MCDDLSLENGIPQNIADTIPLLQKIVYQLLGDYQTTCFHAIAKKDFRIMNFCSSYKKWHIGQKESETSNPSTQGNTSKQKILHH